MPKRGPTPRRVWQPFQQATEVINRVTGEDRTADILAHGEEFWSNNLYNVHLRRMESSAPDKVPNMVHLSICRRDRKPIRDWRDMQRIKNELVGPECEGMEMYPPESDLIDTSNQYHLWVFDDPTIRAPWGFHEGRVVMTPEQLAAGTPGAVQRPYEEEA